MQQGQSEGKGEKGSVESALRELRKRPARGMRPERPVIRTFTRTPDGRWASSRETLLSLLGYKHDELVAVGEPSEAFLVNALSQTTTEGFFLWMPSALCGAFVQDKRHGDVPMSPRREMHERLINGTQEGIWAWVQSGRYIERREIGIGDEFQEVTAVQQVYVDRALARYILETGAKLLGKPAESPDPIIETRAPKETYEHLFEISSPDASASTGGVELAEEVPEPTEPTPELQLEPEIPAEQPQPEPPKAKRKRNRKSRAKGKKAAAPSVKIDVVLHPSLEPEVFEADEADPAIDPESEPLLDRTTSIFEIVGGVRVAWYDAIALATGCATPDVPPGHRDAAFADLLVREGAGFALWLPDSLSLARPPTLRDGETLADRINKGDIMKGRWAWIDIKVYAQSCKIYLRGTHDPQGRTRNTVATQRMLINAVLKLYRAENG